MTAAQYGMTGDDRAAFLARRKLGLGGSDIAAVLGLSPWTSPYSLWAEKVGLLPDIEPTEAMDFGLRAERMLSEWFTEKTGLHIAGEQMQVTGAEPWMRCSLDGLVFDGEPLRDDPGKSKILFAECGDGGAFSIDDAIAAAEWKTTGDTAQEWEEQVPNYYQTQATWTSIVTGLEVVWFGVLHLAFGRPQFRTYEFVPDAEDKALILDRARSFWTSNVLTGIPPDTDGSDATTSALRGAFPGDEDLDAVAATPELVDARDRIVFHKQWIKSYEQRIAEDENLIRAALGDHPAMTNGVDDKGRPVLLATWKPGSRTSIDLDLLKANEPDIAAKFTKTTPTRTLLVKPPKKAK